MHSDISKNRFRGLTFNDDKAMKFSGRGTFQEKQGFYDTTNISVVKSYDNWPVFVAYTKTQNLRQ